MVTGGSELPKMLGGATDLGAEIISMVVINISESDRNMYTTCNCIQGQP